MDHRFVRQLAIDKMCDRHRNGAMVEIGAMTRQLFKAYGIEHAETILGDKLWAEISAQPEPGYFEPQDASYIVSHAPTTNDQINVYLTRLP